MKAKFTYIGLMALLISACGTGSYVTNSYTDDIYFNPADVPPPVASSVVKTTEPVANKSAKAAVTSEIAENNEIAENYVDDIPDASAIAEDYDTNEDFSGMDTISYYDDGEMKQLVDNYYTDDNVDFTYRIYRFHNTAFYDPFYWDSWYYDPFYYDSWGWSMSFNYGWGFGYPYYSWGYPYYSWGYPYYSWGYPYYSWGYPGYGWGYYPPYYGGGGYYPGYYPDYSNPDSYQYGQRRTGGTSVSRNDVRGSNVDGSARASARDKSAGANGVSENGNSRRENSVSGVRTRSSAGETKSVRENSAVLTERRRNSENGSNNYTRQAVVGDQTGRPATQSYTRPSTQTRSYARPGNISSGNSQARVINKSSGNESSSQSYTQPRSTSSYNQTYRSSSTYNRSTSSGVSSRSYRAPSVSSGSDSYRGSSSGSGSSGSYSSGSSRSSSSYSSGSSGGGSYSGGSSSSSSGGGGGRSSGGGSSSSGRR